MSTTITLNLAWLSNEGLAVLLNQLTAAGDAIDADDDIDESELRALDEAYSAVQQALDARVGEDETVQLQTDLDVLLDVAAYRHNKRYAKRYAATRLIHTPAPFRGRDDEVLLDEKPRRPDDSEEE